MSPGFIIKIIGVLASKKNFVVRMDAETYKVLEKWAADEFRSVNGQIEYLINHALTDAGRKKNLPKNNDTLKTHKT